MKETTYPGDLENCVIAIKFDLGDAQDYLVAFCYYEQSALEKKLFAHIFRVTHQFNWESKHDLTECMKDAMSELEHGSFDYYVSPEGIFINTATFIIEFPFSPEKPICQLHPINQKDKSIYSVHRLPGKKYVVHFIDSKDVGLYICYEYFNTDCLLT